MATIVTRSGKGSPLTHNEVDANFTNLNTAKYEAGDSPSFAGLTVDTDTLYVDSTNNRVGVGTASPAAPLHVAGTIADNPAAVGFLAGQINNYGNAKLVGSAGGYIDFTDTSANQKGRIIYAISDNSMSFRTNGANERLRITSGGDVQFYEDTGTTPKFFWDASAEALGIGTSSPSQKLEVSDTAVQNVVLRVTNNDGNAEMQKYQDDLYLNLNDTGNIIVRSGSSITERMRITSGGSVGIGTTNPAGYGNTSKLVVQTASSTDGIVATLANSGSTGAALQFFQTGVDTATVGMPAGSGGIIFKPSGATERMRIDSSGNVGIGTSSPDSSPSTKLHIREDDSTDYKSRAVIQATDQRLVLGSYWQSGVGQYSYVQATNDAESGAQPLLLNPDGGNVLVGTTAATNFVDKMRVIGDTNGVDLGGSSSTGVVRVRGSDTGAALIDFTKLSVNPNSSPFYNGRIFYSFNDNFMRFETNGSERMRISSSGNVGIGTSSPTAKLNIVGDNTQPSLHLQSSDKDIGFSGPLQIGAWDGTTYTERMRISISGNLLVGTTTEVGRMVSESDGSSIAMLALRNSDTGTGAQAAQLFYRNGANTGSITITGSATAYNTSSDYRLKEDVQPMSGASDRLMQLNPVNFAWKIDGSRVDGFLAHEAQEVVPEAVTGEKDAVDKNGNPEYQGIDQSKLVPLLTAALQEAMQKIDALEARVAQLEA